MKKLSIYVLALTVLLSACTTIAASQGNANRNERLKVAEAMFQERCKASGEKIYKTVDGVEGIFLMKIRPEKSNFADQFALDDPYGNDLGGNAYIQSFLRGFFEANGHRAEVPKPNSPLHMAYSYIEAVDPGDSKRYRYTGSIKEVVHTSSIMMGGDGKTKFKTKDFVLDRIPAAGQPPRYGVTYDDISTREEREYWIAGSSLKIVDLQTNEVIAERIGYMMDRGQGNTSAGRSPWLVAANSACPSFSSMYGARAQLLQTQNFVEKVLKPNKDK